MWLINTSSFELLNFIDNDTLPSYAIFSHTWTAEEVSYQELMLGTPQVEAKFGFKKIRKCCELALKDGLDYAWIDTCCIDKTSSAELSESINSMYRWYRQAKICYAFLEDVPAASAKRNEFELFKKSRWFTRGWTLQELLAPNEVIFFSAEWQSIGKKSSLAEPISAVTGISQDILRGETDLQTASLACRMSWAASRNTTRVEDTAYCLMGIFDVNMPMLYGEGEKAFIRLQEEIVKSTEDQSIFAWEDPQASSEELCGLLAPHPRCFRDTGGFSPVADPDPEGESITVTNRGLLLSVRQHTLEPSRPTAMFNCTEFNQAGAFAFIHILPLGGAGSKFARVQAYMLGKASRRGVLKPMIMRQNPKLPKQPKNLEGPQWFSIKSIKLPKRNILGGEELAFFTIAKESTARLLKGSEAPAAKVGGYPGRIYDSPSKYLFQLPPRPMDNSLMLYISAQDQLGFPSWHHARISLGGRGDGTFVVAAAFLGEGDQEYEEKTTTGPERSSKAEPLPATIYFQMENPLMLNATVSWEIVESQTLPCVSLEIVDA